MFSLITELIRLLLREAKCTEPSTKNPTKNPTITPTKTPKKTPTKTSTKTPTKTPTTPPLKDFKEIFGDFMINEFSQYVINTERLQIIAAEFKYNPKKIIGFITHALYNTNCFQYFKFSKDDAGKVTSFFVVCPFQEVLWHKTLFDRFQNSKCHDRKSELSNSDLKGIISFYKEVLKKESHKFKDTVDLSGLNVFSDIGSDDKTIDVFLSFSKRHKVEFFNSKLNKLDRHLCKESKKREQNDNNC